MGLFYIFSTSDWRLQLAVLLVILSLVATSGLGLRVLFPVLRALLLFGVVIFVFQVLFQSGESFLSLGPIELKSRGILVTRQVWLRLANLSLLFVSYLMWTHPVDLALMGIRFGLPYRYAMMIGLALRFFPILQGEVVAIQEAQQVRGQPLHRTRERIAGMLSVMLPFILRALRRTGEITLAMELRGFGYAPTRTFLRRIAMRPSDWLVTGLIALAAGARVVVLAGGL